MISDETGTIEKRIARIRGLQKNGADSIGIEQALILSQSIVYDTVGGSHPIMGVIEKSLASGDWMKHVAVISAVLTLFDEGALRSPRLAIAREIEGSILDIAQAQAEAAENSKEPSDKQIHLAIAAFLTGASLEDALRRLCDARGIEYDTQRTSIAKLQAALYQPSNQVEVISQSENKQITAWGDTRNKADHGRFSEITQTEVVTMILGVRALGERHLS